MAKGKKGGDDTFRAETKRLDRMRRRRTLIPIVVVVVALIAFTMSPWGHVPRDLANSGIRFFHSLMGGEPEPDHKYW